MKTLTKKTISELFKKGLNISVLRYSGVSTYINLSKCNMTSFSYPFTLAEVNST